MSAVTEAAVRQATLVVNPPMISSGYPLHDRDGFIEFATGMWLHTAHLVGKPTVWEVEFTLRELPPTRRLEVVQMLSRHGQVAW